MFTKPDGTDPFHKLRVILSLNLKISSFYAIQDAILFSRCTTPLQIAGRLLYFTGPACVASFMFTATTYTATRLRGVDDFFNYQLGAISMMPVFHRFYKLPFPIAVHTLVPILIIVGIYKFRGSDPFMMPVPHVRFQQKFFSRPELANPQ